MTSNNSIEIFVYPVEPAVIGGVSNNAVAVVEADLV